MLRKRITDDPKFILFYRISAFLISLWGILAHTGIPGGNARMTVFLTYTVQSNIFVCVFFLLVSVKTAKERDNDRCDYGFYPAFSFAAIIDILLTMIIFWVILAPQNWAGLDMTSPDNLTVHLFTPLLIFGDRIMFYRYADMKLKDISYMMIFPYIYVLESSVIGLNRLVLFEGIGGGSYYLYPFLDFDKLGGMVFVNIALLSAFFMGIGYVIFKLEKKFKRT